MVITFLTDFGLRDGFVGTCKGVIRRITPEAEVIDITHGIDPQDVLQGALALADALPFMPAGVHLAVVDPGVGTERRGIVVRSGDGRLHVGPDNGLLLGAVDRLGGIAEARELTSVLHRLQPVSATFHARDVFAPAAAHLARGVEPGELGPAVDPDALVRLHIPEPEVSLGRVRAVVLHVDRFGNLRLNLSPEQLAGAGIGGKARLELAGSSRDAVIGRTFADAAAGGLLLYEDSAGSVSISVAGSSAAEALDAHAGSELEIVAET